MNDRRVMQSSTVVQLGRAMLNRFETAMKASWLLQQIERVLTDLDRGRRYSHTASAVARVGYWVRSAWLYRWLTKEPDPDIIVIDLRETVTVGPILVGLDWLLERTGFWGRSSTVALLGDLLREDIQDRPLRVGGAIVTSALLVNGIVLAALGSLTAVDVIVRLPLLLVAMLATQISASWQEVLESRTAQILRAVLEPPNQPEK